MKPIIDSIGYWIQADRMDFSQQVHIYNVHAGVPVNKDVFNVLNISNEPEPTRMSNEKVLEIADHYDLILTWDEEILSKCRNAILFYCGMTWIPQEYLSQMKIKEYKVSFVCGTKNLTTNHRMRHRVWYRQNEIKIPKVFYNSSHNPMEIMMEDNKTLGPNPWEKFEMFQDFQFHIVIENSNYNNYFSEKIIDSFLCKSIPIYIGCPNIGNFFDTGGIIQVSNEDEIIQACNALNETYYQDHIKAVENNFMFCQEYTKDFTIRLQEVISQYV